MNQQEWTALIELLNRIPVTQAERMWLQEVINREMAKFQKVEDEKAPSV